VRHRAARSADRIIKHEAVPICSSYEVRFPDGRESRFFYWMTHRVGASALSTSLEREDPVRRNDPVHLRAEGNPGLP
jgi:hypothetical protein